ncbi:hypothetical protein [Rhabdothermincola sp.]|uniref:hypothetical protein n=1 Tax=Rhabdothermincola sp. TaxID=2820405 RepID=UPI002FE27D62
MDPFPPQPPPLEGAGPPGPRKVSPAGYWIGGAVIAVGVAIAVVWFVVTLVGLLNAPDDVHRVEVASRTSVALDEGSWVIYVESDSPYVVAKPEVVIRDPAGRVVPLEFPSTSQTYSAGGRHGRSIAEFRARVAGRYTVETYGEPGASSRAGGYRVAIGRPIVDVGSFAGILGAMGVGLVSTVVGVVVIVVTAVRRSPARRAAAPALAPYQPYGPPGPSEWYPPTPLAGDPSAGSRTLMPPPPGPPSGWPPPAPGPGWPPPGPMPPVPPPGPVPPPEVIPPPPPPWEPPVPPRDDEPGPSPWAPPGDDGEASPRSG